MKLTPLSDNWLATAHGLHAGAQLVGEVRKLTTPAQPLYMHLALFVGPYGLSSGRLPAGGEVQLDMRSAAIVYRPAAGDVQTFSLIDRPIASVTVALFGALAQADLAGYLDADAVAPRTLEAAYAAHDRKLPDVNTLFDGRPAAIDSAAAAAYADAFDLAHTALARFRAGLVGMQSPLVVWPHHFDLSGLWFVQNELDDYKPHINFGFAPYSPGIDRPYLYVTAYPLPDEVEAPALPDGARWHTDGWRGIVLPYDVIAAFDDPVATIWSYCQMFYARMRPLLGRQDV